LRSFDFRSNTNFFDQGNFAGVQLRNKAICFYTLKPLENTYVHSIKTVIAFQSGSNLDQVWINDTPVQWKAHSTPIQYNDWIIVEDGTVYIGIRPLEPSCLGYETPILIEQGPLGEMFLSIYNYQGPKKRFWEYASLDGAYWNRNIRAGFIVEVGEKKNYISAIEFFNHLKNAKVSDSVDAEHIRTIRYRNGDESLSLSYDLHYTKAGQRWLNGEILEPSNLDSPFAVQGMSGKLNVGSASLITFPQPVWLIAQELDDADRIWIVVNPQNNVTPLHFETPIGVISASQWYMGSITWRDSINGQSQIVIDTIQQPGELKVPRGTVVQYRQTSVK
jgi:hypothetical protein